MTPGILDDLSALMAAHHCPQSRSEDVAADVEQLGIAAAQSATTGATIECLLRRAARLVQLRRLEEADKVLAQSLDLAQSDYGDDHPEMIRVLALCGMSCVVGGRDTNAFEQLRRAMAAVGGICGDASAKRLLCLQLLALQSVSRSSMFDSQIHLEHRQVLLSRLSGIELSAYVHWLCVLANFAKDVLTRFEAAGRLYDCALETAPSDPVVRSSRATLLWTCLNRADEAERELHRVLMERREPSTLGSLALLRTHVRGDWGSARALFEEAIKTAQGDDQVAACSNYATLAILLNEFDLARRLLKQAVAASPCPRSRFLLRPPFCGMALAALEKSDPTVWLKQLKTILQDPFVTRVPWVITRLREYLAINLGEPMCGLLVAISDAIDSRENDVHLSRFTHWCSSGPMPYNDLSKVNS